MVGRKADQGSGPGEGDMRRVLIASAAAILFGPTVTMAGAGPGPARSSNFPSCVAGTYLGEVTMVDTSFSFQSLNTLGRDGTYVTESTIDYGAGGAAPNAFRSAGRGNWRAIGQHRLRTTYLHFSYDSIGNLLWLEKIDVLLRFDRSCTSAVGDATYSIYLPGQDPFADQPVAGGEATVTMKRMPLD
jgi:hypothetical protein